MEENLKKFFEVITDPYASIAQWKERTGKKVIACYPMHIPEELIHASGVLPVICWRSNEPVTVGHAYWAPFNCGLSRSFVDDAIKGKLKFIDGLVIHHRLCIQADGVASIIERNARPPYFERLILPAIYPNPVIKDFLIQELQRLRSRLEDLVGEKLSPEAINRSIEVYNRDRELMRRFYELRRQKPTAFKAREAMAIVQAAMLMPKEEHARLLEDLLPQLEARAPSPDGKIRVILTGCLCQTPQVDILDLIEDLGMTVVDDDIYVGSRYFINDVAITPDPIESLAERYLRRVPPCPTRGDWESDWGDYLIDMVKRTQAQGIISLMVKFCPPHLCYYPDIKRKLNGAGIPEVLIEVEHEVVSLEGVRTRLQAFSEMIKGG